MARPWKHPDTGIYWLRRRVPDDLRAVLGKREEKSSLGTRDPDIAKVRHAAALAALEVRWSNLRKGPRPLDLETVRDLAAAAHARYVERSVVEPSHQIMWNTEFGAQLWPPRLPPAFGSLAVASKVPQDYEPEEATRLRDWCYDKANECLEANGIVTDDQSRTRLAQAIASRMHSAQLRANEQPYGSVLGAAYFANGEHLHAGSVSSKKSVASNTVSFGELVAGWAKEKKPKAKTKYSWERVIEAFAAFIGHDNAARVSPDDVIRWKSSLIDDELHPKTIRDGKLAPLRAIFQWGVDNLKLGNNPAERVTVDVKVRAGERRRGYTEEEAVKILAAARREELPHRRWIPWICAYSGARVAEVCQLRVEDVDELQGCLRLTAEAGSLKNANSERAIPLHPALLNEGFIDFVQKVGSGPLFADLRPDRFGSRGGTGTKRIGSWVRGMGYKDERLSPNHSWRHRFKTLGRRYGLELDIVNAITGHGRRTVADAYGEFPMSALHREMQKIPSLEIGSEMKASSKRD
jgi:integrase